MRILIYEYACALDDAGGLPESVPVEGRAMRNALLEDFGRIAGVTVFTLSSGPAASEWMRFHDALKHADAALIVAPELHGILLERTRWVEGSRVRLLGSGRLGVALAGDKCLTAKCLRANGVPTPRTWLPGDAATALRSGRRLLRKPRHGAGSSRITWFAQQERLEEEHPAESPEIVQEYVPGLAASASYLVDGETVLPLRAGQQLLDGYFAYRGGVLPLPEDLENRALALGERAVRAIPGLGGFVGVDLVLGEEAAGVADYVIEINPRVTTSYVGLRSLCLDNLAEIWFRVMRGQTSQRPAWRGETLTFTPEGACFRRRRIDPAASDP